MAPRRLPIPSESDSPSNPDTTRFEVEDNHLLRELAGERRKNLRAIEDALDVKVGQRGNVLTITGDEGRRTVTENLLHQLVDLMTSGSPLSPTDIAHAAKLAAASENVDLREFMNDTIVVTARRKPITPRSPNQKRYADAMRNHDVVFGVGPAGTGKTYLAVAMAVAALQSGAVRRIILTRPAVEAGEKLGFLPGDLAEKVNPYLRPLYDALQEMLDPARCARFIEQGTIEVAPLAFMRGRTLNDAFVIMDEAQNSTRQQMKMFLTRLGTRSQAVITGDITQIDLERNQHSGLVHAKRILSHIDAIPFIQFERVDVVRHPLVRRILHAYERAEAQERSGNGQAQA
jgi:phosphate starvation-inducible protein PhoH and related proteins